MGSPLQTTSTPTVFAALAAGAAENGSRIDSGFAAHRSTRAAGSFVADDSERGCLPRSPHPFCGAGVEGKHPSGPGTLQRSKSKTFAHYLIIWVIYLAQAPPIYCGWGVFIHRTRPPCRFCTNRRELDEERDRLRADVEQVGRTASLSMHWYGD